jgi:hypothetical protein
MQHCAPAIQHLSGLHGQASIAPSPSCEPQGGVSVKFNWQGQPFHVDLTGAFELEFISILLYVDDMAILADNETNFNHCIQVLEAIT